MHSALCPNPKSSVALQAVAQFEPVGFALCLVPNPKCCVALQAVTQFEPAGAAMLLEEEIREALVGTAGTVGGKPSVAQTFSGICVQMSYQSRVTN